MRLNASLRLIVSLVLAAGSSSGYATLSCTMPSGVSLNFGNYDDTSTANTDVSATFTDVLPKPPRRQRHVERGFGS